MRSSSKISETQQIFSSFGLGQKNGAVGGGKGEIREKFRHKRSTGVLPCWCLLDAVRHDPADIGLVATNGNLRMYLRK